KALRKEPRSRYGSAHELAEDLQHWLEHRPILARPIGRTERLRMWVRRSPTQALALAALVVLLLMGGVTLLARLDSVEKTNSLTRQQLKETQREKEEQTRLTDIDRKIVALFAQA